MPRQYTLRLPSTHAEGYDEAAARFREFAVCCREVLADGVVTDEEAHALNEWLDQSWKIVQHWPFSGLASRLRICLKECSAGDQKLLIEILSEIGSGTDLEQGCREDDFTAPVPQISFEGKWFVFSGIFLCGSRASCEDRTSQAGGCTLERVSGVMDYLVLGAICNPRWAKAGRGRKLLNTLALLEKHGGVGVAARPAIVRERDWFAAVNAAPKDHDRSAEVLTRRAWINKLTIEPKQDGPIVCFTGSGPKRAMLSELAIAMGYTVRGSVSKKCTLLVVGETPGGKLQEARNLGCPTMSIDEFMAKAEAFIAKTKVPQSEA